MLHRNLLKCVNELTPPEGTAVAVADKVKKGTGERWDNKTHTNT